MSGNINQGRRWRLKFSLRLVFAATLLVAAFLGALKATQNDAERERNRLLVDTYELCPLVVYRLEHSEGRTTYFLWLFVGEVRLPYETRLERRVFDGTRYP